MPANLNTGGHSRGPAYQAILRLTFLHPGRLAGERSKRDPSSGRVGLEGECESLTVLTVHPYPLMCEVSSSIGHLYSLMRFTPLLIHRILVTIMAQGLGA